MLNKQLVNVCLSNKVCDYCNKSVTKYVLCNICNKNCYHESCSKRVCVIVDKLVKCPACVENKVNQISRNHPKVSSNEILSMFQELKSSVDVISEKFDENLRENKPMLEELKQLRSETTTLRNKVKTLEKRINTLEASETSCSIEISDVRIGDSDNPKPVIMEIANDLLACNIKDSDLDKCYCKSTRKGVITLAKFKSKDIKDNVLRNRRGTKLHKSMSKH